MGDLAEAGRPHAVAEGLAVGELADGLGEVLVGVAVVLDEELADPRQDVLEVQRVDAAHHGPPRAGELQHRHAAAGGRDAGQFPKPRVGVRDVPQAEGDGDDLERVGRERQPLRVGLGVGHAAARGLLVAGEGQHFVREVGADDGGVGRLGVRDGEVPGAAAGVEDRPPRQRAARRRRDGLDGDPPPPDVHAAGERVVHQVVAAADLREHVADAVAGLVDRRGLGGRGFGGRRCGRGHGGRVGTAGPSGTSRVGDAESGGDAVRVEPPRTPRTPRLALEANKKSRPASLR